MELPAAKIAPADPLCPSCGQVVAEHDAACTSCGYGFEFAARLLPYEAPALRKFIDFDGLLSREDIRVGKSALEKLRTHFPQVTVCTCLAKVPEEVSVSEFGFWLFNQSVPNGPRLNDRQFHSILLNIDPDRGEAALTVGYGLDPFIDDSSLDQCLAKIRRHLENENYGGAIKKLCRALRPILEHGFQSASIALAEHVGEMKHQQQKTRKLNHQRLPSRRATASRAETHDTHV